MAIFTPDFVEFKTPFQTDKLLLLDRDGTINKDTNGYIYDVSAFEFTEEFLEIAPLLCKLRINISVVTNQGGVSKEFFNDVQSRFFSKKVTEECRSKGILIHSVISCFHQLSDECLCRKPSGRMLEYAMSFYGAAIENTLFIGNTMIDELAATNAKVRYSNINDKDLKKLIGEYFR